MSITYNIELNKDKIDSFHDVITEVTESVFRVGTQIIYDLLERLDTNIRESIDTSKYRNKGKRKNSIKTRIGVVEYSRTMYRELETGLMDQTVDYKVVDPNVNEDMKFSVSMVPKSEGKGYECPHNISIPANLS